MWVMWAKAEPDHLNKIVKLKNKCFVFYANFIDKTLYNYWSFINKGTEGHVIYNCTESKQFPEKKNVSTRI